MSEALSFDKGGAEREKETLVVEIGSGRIPFARGAATLVPQYGEYFRKHPDLKYVGADIFPSDPSVENMYAGPSVQAQFAPDQLRYKQIESQGKLPFADESVAEVIMQNVLGAGAISFDRREEMLRESARILKPNGILKVIEIVTPEGAVCRGGPVEYIKKDLGAIFEEVEDNDQQISEVEPLDREYLRQLSREGNEFILRFRKKIQRAVPTSRLDAPNESEK